MTITMKPSNVAALLHRSTRHPGRVKSDWDIHGCPHHTAFIESALMLREMDRL